MDVKSDPARFVKPLTSMNTVPGKVVRFEVVVAGTPQPQVSWFKEGHPIRPSHEFQVGIGIMKQDKICTIL